MRTFIHTVVVALNIGLASSWCYPWQSSGSATIYRNTGLTGDTSIITSGDSCQNILGAWKSAKSNGGYLCRIFRSKDCSGDFKDVDSAGYKYPGFEIQSVECPCF